MAKENSKKVRHHPSKVSLMIASEIVLQNNSRNAIHRNTEIPNDSYFFRFAFFPNVYACVCVYLLAWAAVV